MITTDFIVKLFIALLLGAAIGMERQWRQRMAGLRTNMLVCLGAAMFVSLAVNIGGDAVGRVTSYVVSGIGFLGAGVIMKDGVNVSGLNTAATLWCSAAIGTFCGTGYVTEAVAGTFFVVLTHLIMRPVGLKLSRSNLLKREAIHTDYLFTIRCKEEIENHLRVLLIQYIQDNDKLLLRSLASNDNISPSDVVITAEIRSIDLQDIAMEKIASRITVEKEVSRISWEVVGEQNDL